MSISLYISYYLDKQTFSKFYLLSRKIHQELIQQLKISRALYYGWEKLAELGDLDGIKILDTYYSRNIFAANVCSYHVMDFAANFGHLHVIKWLHNHRIEGCSHYAIDWAAKKGYEEVVEWLLENRTEGFSEWAIIGAAAGGYLGIVRKLRLVKYFKNEMYVNFNLSCLDTLALDMAANEGHLEVVKYLYENEYIGTNNALLNAIINKDDEMVDYLCEKELYCDDLKEIWFDAIITMNYIGKHYLDDEYKKVYRIIYNKMVNNTFINNDIYHRFMFDGYCWLMDKIVIFDILTKRCGREFDRLLDKIIGIHQDDE